MRIIIYNPLSFGGTYQYLKELVHYLKQSDKVDSVTVVLPENAIAKNAGNAHFLVCHI